MSDELRASDVESEHAVKDDEHIAVLEDLEASLTGDRDAISEHVNEAQPCSLECWMQQHSSDEKAFLQDVKLVCQDPGRALFLLCSKLVGLSRADSASACQ